MTNNNMYFIANWKMYGIYSSVNSINSVIKLSKLKKYKKTRIIYCPPYTLLKEFVKKTEKSKILVGAQNCHYEKKFGAYTGSISAKMIKNIGSQYVILGHSENRILGENNSLINKKIKSSLEENLKVIFCVGETLNEKRNKKTIVILKKQIREGLKGIKNLKNIIIAYEPVWSIGSGKILKSQELKKQILSIKKILKKLSKNNKVKILYGGSVSKRNIKMFSEINEINGFLIGGASQKAKNFIDIIKKSIN
tara:strand:+ start:1174 stop:1926 length:753 start_codon:yes stop_codon:yes gene_type:complete